MAQYQAPKTSKLKPILVSLGGLLVAYTVWAMVRPLPDIVTSALPVSLPAEKTAIIGWPDKAQAAIGAEGYGLLSTHADQVAVPTASVAKVVAALLVLQQQPLKTGETGPTITITQQDVDDYTTALKENGSVVPVNLGEDLTEYQALQALMLPSGNNIAVLLTRWAYGSVDAYLAAANQFANENKLAETHFDDPSGFSPKTVSSAQDEVRIGLMARGNPVLAEIVSQSEVTLPVVGKVKNVNSYLTKNGINGIKTGNTDEAGGCFLFSAEQTLATGQKVTVVAAVMGASNLANALADSTPILNSTKTIFKEKTVVKAQTEVGIIQTPWGTTAKLVASQDLKGVIWTAGITTPKITLKNLKATSKSGTDAGTVSITSAGTTVNGPLVLATKIPGPSILWRLAHPY